MKVMTAIEGSLAARARTGTTTDGRGYANFRVAVDQERRNPDTGFYEKVGTSWFHVSVFGTLAANAAYCLGKGDRVVVAGELKLREWDNGEKSGTSGDITAYAIGPSLRFGLARLTPTKALENPSPAPAEDEPPAGAAGGWDGIGATGGESPPAVFPESAEPEEALVGAVPGGAAPGAAVPGDAVSGGEDPPF
jgi:single-strand DNA-binding protein